MKPVDDRKSAREHGRLSFKSGAPRTACPFCPHLDTSLRREWQSGWDTARYNADLFASMKGSGHD